MNKEELAKAHALKEFSNYKGQDYKDLVDACEKDFIAGYEAKEADRKDKMFTLEDMNAAIEKAFKDGCELESTDGNSCDLLSTKKYILNSFPSLPTT